MNSSVVKKEGNTVTLKIVIENEEFEKAVAKSYKKNVSKFNIPGFRKGKAPRKIVEMQYGEGVFYEDALKFVFPEAYSKAIRDNRLEPVNEPEISIEEIGKGKDLVINTTVTVKPEFELNNYKGIEIEKKEYNVTEQDVENEIERLKRQNARQINVEDRPVKEGDIVNVVLEGFLDGKPIDEYKGEDLTLTVGKNHFIPGFDEKLIGRNLNEEFEINITFPEDYFNEKLAGKNAVFKVKINNIKVVEYPEVDDEFAKDVSEFDTLEELKENIRENMVKEAENRAQREMEEEAVNRVVELAEIDIPDVMIENEIDRIIRNYEYNLRYQGINIDEYLKIRNMSKEELRDDLREDALNNVKRGLVLEKIIELENIEPSEEEIENELKKLAEIYNKDFDEYKSSVSEHQLSFLKDQLSIRKAVEFIYENAVKVEKKTDGKNENDKKDIKDESDDID